MANANIKLNISKTALPVRIFGSSRRKETICSRLKAEKVANGISFGLLSEFPRSRGVNEAMIRPSRAMAQLSVKARQIKPVKISMAAPHSDDIICLNSNSPIKL